MSKSLLDLAKYAEHLRVAIPEGASELVKKVVSVIHTKLVLDTPVDTSKALSNWVVQVGGPWSVELDAYIEGNFGSTQEASGNLALQAGEKQIALKQPGEPVHITNNAPYIKDLNDGSSKQAPAGFIEKTVMIGRKAAEQHGIQVTLSV